MMMNLGKVIKINATHRHTKIVLQELRFQDQQILGEVKDALSKKFGTLPEYMKLKLVKNDGTEKPLGQYDEDKKLMKDPEYKKKVKESQGPTYEEEAKAIKVGNRCIVGDGTRRGRAIYAIFPSY